MNYHEIAPNLPLSRFINKAWFLSHSPPHRQEKILPLPVHHFIINLSDEPYRVVWQGGRVRSWTFAGGFVSGIQSSYLIIENPARILHVGVELTPYGLAAFTSAAPDSYSNTVQPSEHLLVGSHALASQLKRMASPETQLQKLLEFMAAKLRPEFALQAYLEPSLGLLATTPSVAEVARTAGVSHKQLASQWKRYAGITPKQYQNIVRLQQVVAWLSRLKSPRNGAG